MNYNKVILLGNLTRDPQLSTLPSGTEVVEFGLAVNRKWRSQNGQQKEEVCFVDCRAYGKTAGTINQYLKKGNPALVEGRLTFDTWEAQDGGKRSKHRVTVERFTFVGSKDDSAPPSRPAPQPAPSGYVAPDFPNADDIPF